MRADAPAFVPPYSFNQEVVIATSQNDNETTTNRSFQRTSYNADSSCSRSKNNDIDKRSCHSNKKKQKDEKKQKQNLKSGREQIQLKSNTTLTRRGGKRKTKQKKNVNDGNNKFKNREHEVNPKHDPIQTSSSSTNNHHQGNTNRSRKKKHSNHYEKKCNNIKNNESSKQSGKPTDIGTHNAGKPNSKSKSLNRNKSYHHRNRRRIENHETESFQKEYSSTYNIDNATTLRKNDKSILFYNENSFPTLLQFDEKEINDGLHDIGSRHNGKNIHLRQQSHENLWANVAHQGHQCSIQREDQLQKQLQQIEYEKATYTRMEVIRLEDQNQKHDHKEEEHDDHYIEKEEEFQQGPVSFSPPVSTPTLTLEYNHEETILTLKPYKVDKLKRRWLRILKEKEEEKIRKLKEEEEEEVLKKESNIDDGNHKNYSDKMTTCGADTINSTENEAAVNSAYSKNENADIISILSSSSSSSSLMSSSDSSVSSASSNYSDSNDSSILSSTSSLVHYLDTEYPLHFAIMMNDDDAVRNLLSLPPDLTSRDEHVPIKMLLKLKKSTTENNVILSIPSTIDINKKVSILHFTILLHRPNILHVMVSCGKRYNLEYVTSTLSIDETKNDFKSTALMIACKYSLDNCIKVLLSFGPKVNIKQPLSGNHALHFACQYADPSSVQLLLSSCKSNQAAQQRMVCARNKLGQTPFDLSCSIGRIEIVEMFLTHCSAKCLSKLLGIENNKGYTPLLSAIEADGTDIVFDLLTWRSNLRCPILAPQHTCPLTLAVSIGSMAMVDLVIECIDSLEYSFDFSGALYKTLTTFNEKSCCEDGLRIIELLIEAGADPFATFTHDHNVETQPYKKRLSFVCNNPITVAIHQGSVRFVACMLDSFLKFQRKMQIERRVDKVLQMQPKTYFDTKDKAENDYFLKSGQDALLTGLLLCRNDDFGACSNNLLTTRRLGCCLCLFRRGISIDKVMMLQLIKGMSVDVSEMERSQKAVPIYSTDR